MGKDIGTDRPWNPSPHRASGEGYILHHVSKLDTLAGVAIKYGVEVSDIKRANGLVSDFQMFAHKTIRIPVCAGHSSLTSLTESDNLSSMSPIKKAAHHDAVGVKRHVLPAMIYTNGSDGMSSSSSTAEHTHYAHHLGKHSYDEFLPPISKSARHANSVTRANARGGKAQSQLPSDTNSLQEDVIFSADMADSDKINEKSVRRRSKADSNNSLIGSTEAKYHKQEIGILDGMLPNIFFSSNTENSDGMFISILKLLDGTLFGGKGRANTASTFSSLEHKAPHINTGAYNSCGTNPGFSNQVSLSNFARPLFEGISKSVPDKAARD